ATRHLWGYWGGGSRRGGQWRPWREGGPREDPDGPVGQGDKGRVIRGIDRHGMGPDRGRLIGHKGVGACINDAQDRVERRPRQARRGPRVRGQIVAIVPWIVPHLI